MIALIRNEPMSAHTGPNLVFISWPTVTCLIKMVHQSCIYKHQDTHEWIHVCIYLHTCLCTHAGAYTFALGFGFAFLLAEIFSAILVQSHCFLFACLHVKRHALACGFNFWTECLFKTTYTTQVLLYWSSTKFQWNKNTKKKRGRQNIWYVMTGYWMMIISCFNPSDTCFWSECWISSEDEPVDQAKHWNTSSLYLIGVCNDFLFLFSGSQAADEGWLVDVVINMACRLPCCRHPFPVQLSQRALCILHWKMCGQLQHYSLNVLLVGLMNKMSSVSGWS